MENVGFEPTAFRMQSEHSTPELIPLLNKRQLQDLNLRL